MVNWEQFEERQRGIFRQEQGMAEANRQMFDFPAQVPTELLSKPMNPTDSFDGIITRDITTANIPESQAKEVSFLLTSAVALNESRELFGIKDNKEADKWLLATITNIKASAMSRTAVSKGIKGWLGELFVTMKRTGDMTTKFEQEKKGLLK